MPAVSAAGPSGSSRIASIPNTTGQTTSVAAGHSTVGSPAVPGSQVAPVVASRASCPTPAPGSRASPCQPLSSGIVASPMAPPSSTNTIGIVVIRARSGVVVTTAVAGAAVTARASPPSTARASGSSPGSVRLIALERYLREHAGRLDASPGPDGTFRLDAVLPGAAK